MRTLGFGEGRQAEQAMPQASGRSPGAKRSQSLPLRASAREGGMRTLGFGEPAGRTDNAGGIGPEARSEAQSIPPSPPLFYGFLLGDFVDDFCLSSKKQMTKAQTWLAGPCGLNLMGGMVS